MVQAHGKGDAELSFDGVLLRYDEIGLKSNSVRKRMEDLLMHRVREALDYRGARYGRVGSRGGRFFIDTDDVETCVEAARTVFGVVSVSPSYLRKLSVEEGVAFAGDIGEASIGEGESFAIRSRRVGQHDFTSLDVARMAGAEVQERTGAEVDLDEPDVEIFVEVRGDLWFFYTEKLDGPRGMPLGTQGKMVALISGGIDSPVATWMMMKRGVQVIPVFLDNAPFTDDTTRGRTVASVERLAEWNQGPLKSYFAPHGSTLEAILNDGVRKLTCVLCRRVMYRVAERIAEVEECDGIVTGESLGQVASQTYRNLRAEDDAIDMPVYRPVIGMDKLEIIDIAKDIGTFDTSTKPATCCTITPDYPETYADLDEVHEAEEELDIDAIVDAALEDAEIIEIGAESLAE